MLRIVLAMAFSAAFVGGIAGEVATSGAAWAQSADQAASCANLAAACGRTASPACPQRAGAGSAASTPPKGAGPRAAACDAEAAVYRDCLRQVAEQCGGADPQSQDEARRALAELGAQWSEQEFLRSIRETDARAVRLFTEGGMRMTGAQARLWIRPEHLQDDRYHPEIAEVLLAAKAIDTDELCAPKRSSFKHYQRVEPLKHADHRLGTLKTLCATPETLAEIDKRIAAEEARIGAAAQSNSARTRSVKLCYAAFRRENDRERVLQEASRFSGVSGGASGPPRGVILATLKQWLLDGGRGDPERAYQLAIVKGCAAAHREKMADSEKLDELKAARALLGG